MASPIIEKEQSSIGRYGYATFRAEWTAVANDDLNSETILANDEFSDKFNNPYYAVERIDWVCALNVQANIYFDSVPPGPDGNVLSIPGDATSGQLDFTTSYNGCRPDPASAIQKANPDTQCMAGSLVIDATGLPDDNLFCTVTYREKGGTNGK